MKFNVCAGKIASSLYNIIGIVNKKSPLSSLANVKLILKHHSLELITSDLEISISEILEVEGIENGIICIDATMFYDAVRRIKNDSVLSFFTTNSRLTITNNVTKFLIPFITDEPNIALLSNDNKKYEIIIPFLDSINFFEKTKCAIALENTRANLTGVFFHTHNGMICTAATDCNRLAYSSSKIEFADEIQLIIPRKTVLELNKLVAKLKPQNISLSLHGHETITRIVFEFSNIQITTKLVAGQFPNYQKVIPSNSKINLILDTKKIVEVIERVSIIATEKNRAIKFNIAEGKLKVYMSNIDSGFAEEIVDISNDLSAATDPALEIALNYNYLLESLHLIDSTKVSIKIIDGKSAILIEDMENKNIGYVVMPMIG